MTISEATKELLKVRAGRGFSHDPALTARHKIKLLQNTSKLPRHGRGEPGMFVLPDPEATCSNKVRAILGAIYSIYVERAPDGKPAGSEHFILPDGAARDGFGWILPNGNTLETEARCTGLFDDVEGENLDLARTGMKVARSLNSDARARATKHGLPICGLAYEFSSTENTSDRGLVYYGVTFRFLGAIGEPEGPSEEEIIRAAAVGDLVEPTLAAATREAEDRKRLEIAPGRMSITSGRSARAARKRRRSTALSFCRSRERRPAHTRQTKRPGTPCRANRAKMEVSRNEPRTEF